MHLPSTVYLARRAIGGIGCIDKRQRSLMQVPAKDIQR
jgi:hypothetical protein